MNTQDRGIYMERLDDLSFSQKVLFCRRKDPKNDVIADACFNLEYGVSADKLVVSLDTTRIKCGTRTEILEVARAESGTLGGSDRVIEIMNNAIPFNEYLNVLFDAIVKSQR